MARVDMKWGGVYGSGSKEGYRNGWQRGGIAVGNRERLAFSTRITTTTTTTTIY